MYYYILYTFNTHPFNYGIFIIQCSLIVKIILKYKMGYIKLKKNKEKNDEEKGERIIQQ